MGRPLLIVELAIVRVALGPARERRIAAAAPTEPLRPCSRAPPPTAPATGSGAHRARPLSPAAWVTQTPTRPPEVMRRQHRRARRREAIGSQRVDLVAAGKVRGEDGQRAAASKAEVRASERQRFRLGRTTIARRSGRSGLTSFTSRHSASVTAPTAHGGSSFRSRSTWRRGEAAVLNGARATISGSAVVDALRRYVSARVDRRESKV